MNEDAFGNRKLFWKDAKNVRNLGKNDCASIRDMHRSWLIDKGEVKSRLGREGGRQYFDELLNVRMQEEAQVNMVGFWDVNRVIYRGMEAIKYTRG